MDQFDTIGLSPEETNALLAAAAAASPIERSMLEEQVITAHLALAARIAGRYSRRGIELDDLQQVANMALVKAVRRFNPERGQFIAFAAVTISGEIKKYFRDAGWMVRPPRSVQLIQAALGKAQQNGAAFDADGLAAELEVDRKAVIDAAAARGCFAAASLDAPTAHGGRTLGDSMVSEGLDLQLVEGWVDFRPAWNALDEDEKELLKLRFFDDLTQESIAKAVGCSQMQVSRRLKSVLAKVRQIMSVPTAA